MMWTLDLSSFTSNLRDRLEAITGRPWGDAIAPPSVGGTHDLADYPYGILTSPVGTQADPSLFDDGRGARKNFAIKCVGVSRLQAEWLRGQAYAVLLDPAVDLDTAAAKVIGRRTVTETEIPPGDGDAHVFNADATVELYLTPA